MALDTLGLNRSRSAIVFLVPESVNGTIFTDLSSGLPQRPKHVSDTNTDAFGLVAVPVIGQQGNYSDTSEIGPELITTDRVLNYMEYSTFDLEYYAKPGGRTTAIATVPSCTPSKIADVGSLAEVKLVVSGAGKFNGMAIGDTIVVSGTNDADSDGTFMVHSVSLSGTSPFITYLAKVPQSGLNPSGSGAQVSKVVMALPKEDVILSRCFGGTKFMSFAHNGYASGSSSTTSGSSSTAVSSTNCTVVSYFLKNISQTLTVHSRQFTEDSIQMYTATGSLPTSFNVTFAKDGAVTYSSGFQANRVFYTGTAEITGGSGTATADTDITEVAHASGTFTVKVLNPKRHFKDADANASDVLFAQTVSGAFTAGSFVKIRRKATSGTAGDTDHGPYEVKGISGNVVTLGGSGSSDTIAQSGASAFYLIPHMPDAALSTTVLDQRKVQVFIADAVKDTGNNLLHYNPLVAGKTDAESLAKATTATSSSLFNLGNALDVTSVNFDFDRAITTPALTEMSGEEFPAASYVINEPTISGSMTLLLRPKDFQFMNSLREEPRRSIGVRAGSVDGKIIEMGAASAFFEVPTPADADGATQIDIPFTVIRGNLGETDDANKFFLRYR